LERACPGVSGDMIRRLLRDSKSAGRASVWVSGRERRGERLKARVADAADAPVLELAFAAGWAERLYPVGVNRLAALAETQRLARLYERKLAALAALKKSLLHQAFTGQL